MPGTPRSSAGRSTVRMTDRPRFLAPLRRAAFPPVDDMIILGKPLEIGCDPLDADTDAGAPAELPQLPGRTMVVVHHFVNVVGVPSPGPPVVDRRRDALHQ